MISNNWLDYTILGVVILSILTGLFRGFIKEVIALCIWVLAIWLSVNYTTTFESFTKPYIHDDSARFVITFISILLLTFIAGGLINLLLSLILKSSGLTVSDRILGMGFGFLRGIFITSLFMVIVKMMVLPIDESKKQSKLYTKFDPIVDWMYSYTPQLIAKFKVLDKGEIVLDKEDIKKNNIAVF